MALSPNPLRRRLALAVGGAILLAGGASVAYATSVQNSSTPVESGYATVVESQTSPRQAATDGDCPERSGSDSSSAPSSPDSSGAPSAPAPSAPAPGDGDV